MLRIRFLKSIQYLQIKKIVSECREMFKFVRMYQGRTEFLTDVYIQCECNMLFEAVTLISQLALCYYVRCIAEYCFLLFAFVFWTLSAALVAKKDAYILMSNVRLTATRTSPVISRCNMAIHCLTTQRNLDKSHVINRLVTIPMTSFIQFFAGHESCTHVGSTQRALQHMWTLSIGLSMIQEVLQRLQVFKAEHKLDAQMAIDTFFCKLYTLLQLSHQCNHGRPIRV